MGTIRATAAFALYLLKKCEVALYRLLVLALVHSFLLCCGCEVSAVTSVAGDAFHVVRH